MKQLTVLTIALALFTISIGCAPLPPVEGEMMVKEETVPDLSQAERDSLIGVRLSFAYEYYKNGNYASAREHYEVVYMHDVDRKNNIFRAWADCFVRSQMLDSARFAYEEGIKYFADDDYLRSSLSIMYRNAGELDAAIEQQLEAIRIKPENVDYLMSLADMYELQENWEAALDTYKQIAEMKPDDENINRRIVNITRTHFSAEEYIKTLKEAVDQFPDDPRKRFDYGRALLEQGQTIFAVDQLQKYTELKPGDPEGWEMLFDAHQNLSDYKAAIGDANKILEIAAMEGSNMRDRDVAATHVDIGKTYLQLKNWKAARSSAYKALEVVDGFGSAYVLLGNIYYQAADAASGASPKYNDKLVYTIAYGLYKKAANSSDPEAQSDGERWMRALSGGELVPSKEERFMHTSDVRPKGNSYSWINDNWSEVKYVDSYLKGL